MKIGLRSSMLVVARLTIALAIIAQPPWQLHAAVDIPALTVTVNDVTLTAGVAVDRSNGRIYVTEGSFFPEQRTVAVIDGATHRVANRIRVPHAWPVALNQATKRMYVTDRPPFSSSMKTTLTVIDITTDTITTTISGLTGEAFRLAVNEASNRIYVPLKT